MSSVMRPAEVTWPMIVQPVGAGFAFILPFTDPAAVRIPSARLNWLRDRSAARRNRSLR